MCSHTGIRPLKQTYIYMFVSKGVSQYEMFVSMDVSQYENTFDYSGVRAYTFIDDNFFKFQCKIFESNNGKQVKT